MELNESSRLWGVVAECHRAINPYMGPQEVNNREPLPIAWAVLGTKPCPATLHKTELQPKVSS